MKLITLLSLVLIVNCAVFAHPQIDESTVRPVSELDRDYFQRTNPHLSPMAFYEKWQSLTQQNAAAFFFSFVPSYFHDLGLTPGIDEAVPCFGDLHPENFGFLTSYEGTEFAYTDFDDSGMCPASLDILRFFVSLRLEKEEGIRELAEDLESVLTGKDAASKLSSHLFADLEKRRKKQLEKYTEGDAFLLDRSKDLAPTPNKLAVEISRQVRHTYPDVKILDQATYVKEDGGSGGLRRYWLLVRISQHKDILELKKVTVPGSQQHGWETAPQPRIEWATNVFWSGITTPYYKSFSFSDGTYFIRSRSQQNISADDYSNSDWRKILFAETGKVATHYRGRMSADGLADWLVSTSKFVADRWKIIFQQALADTRYHVQTVPGRN